MDHGVVNLNLVRGLVSGDLGSYLSANHRFVWIPSWGSSALSQGGFFVDASWLNLALALGGLGVLLVLGRFFF